MTAITVTVHGTPIPQGSMKAYCRGGRAILIHDRNSELDTWRKKISIAARCAAHQAHWKLPLDQPVKIEAWFLLLKPKTVTRKYPSTKPDLDKLARAIGDALCPREKHQRILAEDSRIIDWTLHKRYTDNPENTGTCIYITPI